MRGSNSSSWPVRPPVGAEPAQARMASDRRRSPGPYPASTRAATLRLVTRRRTTLMAIVALLLLGNIVFFAWWRPRTASAEAIITHVGIDSLVIEVAKGQPAAMLRRKGWNPDPIADSRVRFAAATETGVPRQVTLMSAPTYEQFIISIRDLRAHGICNVAILEAGTPVLGGPQFPGGRDVPTLVLCGNSIGHEGFFGRLAPDTHIRIRLHQPEQ